MVAEKQKRGFALLSTERVKQLGSKGGKNAHALGHAYEFSEDEAREAGRKGGIASQAKRKTSGNE